jgi:predicted DNA-binding protein (MmcQ/YjbR family)
MILAEFHAHCLSLPGAEETTPFGPDVIVYKVAGKMFALSVPDESPHRVNLKCDPERALELRDRYEEITPGYHMNKKHWNTVQLGGRLSNALVKELIEHSYALVVASLPKKVKEELKKRNQLSAATKKQRK